MITNDKKMFESQRTSDIGGGHKPNYGLDFLI